MYHVSGEVTFDNEPVPGGYVMFSPNVLEGNDGRQGYAEIKDGRYDTAGSGKGITGGAYMVLVRGFLPPQGDAPGKMLFRQYEKAIELPTADSQQEIIVPASARDKTGVLPDVT